MDAGLAVRSPMGFAAYCNPRLYMPAHLRYLNARLRVQMATPGSVTLIHAPPRHGKSMLCSWALPTWYLGNNPDQRIMLFAHSDKFAGKWGRKCRDTMDYYGRQLWGYGVNRDKTSANSWELEGHEGGMEAMGVGAGAVGLGADLIVLDDPIRKPSDALSSIVRQGHWDWWNGVAENRLEPGGKIVVIMHRWFADDIVGRMIESMTEAGQPFEEIRLAAIAEDDDVLGRPAGEALWPQRYPIEMLRRKERMQGPWFSALYQGRPTPHGGALFKGEWFDDARFDTMSEGSGRQGYVLRDTGDVYAKGDCYHFVICDPSLGKKHSDRCGIGAFAVTPNRKLLALHYVAKRIPVEDIPARVAEIANTWDAAYVGLEANGFQIQIANSCRNICKCPVKELSPAGKSKFVRSIPAVELARQGKVMLPTRSMWGNEFTQWLCTWTGRDDERDEEVDVLSYAVNEIAEHADEYCEDEPFAFGGGFKERW